MHEFIGAIDQGTSSTRFLIFDTETSSIVAKHQVELSHTYPEPGWVEMDPLEILQSVKTCMVHALEEFRNGGRVTSNIKTIGITNQRETLIIWNKETGQPLCNAIVWMDTRSANTCSRLIKDKGKGDKECLQNKCGLPISPYFTAPKLRWAIDHVKDVRKSIKDNHCIVGTVDTWLVWNLLGGSAGKDNHITDVTNASRTMLMNLKTMVWDAELCKFFDIPMNILPKIVSSSDNYGTIAEGLPLAGISVTSILGDQQAALVGQKGFARGVTKNTYGTGCFLLFNTGHEPIISSCGLLSTIAYKFGNAKPVYALEGSVAVAGAAVTWLRDNLGFFEKSSDVEKYALKCNSTEGLYFVPNFTGAFCPYWREDARGSLVGLSFNTKKSHICRAALESVAFQTEELLRSFESDTSCKVKTLLVDGGMTKNQLLMQIQSDISGIEVQTRDMVEVTGYGVAIAAAKHLGIEFVANQSKHRIYSPVLSESSRMEKFRWWKKAVETTFGWADASHNHDVANESDEHKDFREMKKHSTKKLMYRDSAHQMKNKSPEMKKKSTAQTGAQSTVNMHDDQDNNKRYMDSITSVIEPRKGRLNSENQSNISPCKSLHSKDSDFLSQMSTNVEQSFSKSKKKAEKGNEFSNKSSDLA